MTLLPEQKRRGRTISISPISSIASPTPPLFYVAPPKSGNALLPALPCSRGDVGETGDGDGECDDSVGDKHCPTSDAPPFDDRVRDETYARGVGGRPLACDRSSMTGNGEVGTSSNVAV